SRVLSGVTRVASGSLSEIAQVSCQPGGPAPDAVVNVVASCGIGRGAPSGEYISSTEAACMISVIASTAASPAGSGGCVTSLEDRSPPRGDDHPRWAAGRS